MKQWSVGYSESADKVSTVSPYFITTKQISSEAQTENWIAQSYAVCNSSIWTMKLNNEINPRSSRDNCYSFQASRHAAAIHPNNTSMSKSGFEFRKQEQSHRSCFAP